MQHPSGATVSEKASLKGKEHPRQSKGCILIFQNWTRLHEGGSDCIHDTSGLRTHATNRNTNEGGSKTFTISSTPQACSKASLCMYDSKYGTPGIDAAASWSGVRSLAARERWRICDNLYQRGREDERIDMLIKDARTRQESRKENSH